MTGVVEETVAGWHHKERRRGDRRLWRKQWQGGITRRGVEVTEVVEETVAGWHHKEGTE